MDDARTLYLYLFGGGRKMNWQAMNEIKEMYCLICRSWTEFCCDCEVEE